MLNNLMKRRPIFSFDSIFGKKTNSKSPRRYLWVQAASAGEVRIAQTFIKAFQGRIGQMGWLIITTTHSGYQMAQQVFQEQVEIVYLPRDFSFIIRNWFKKYPPFGFFIVENEVWPNLIAWLAKKNIHSAMLNGKVNDRTYQRYKKIEFFLYPAFQQMDLFCVQSSRDAERLIALGAIPKRVSIIGNAKYDQEFPDISEAEKNHFLQELGMNNQTKILIAGSTHPGEEEMVLDAFQIIKKMDPKAVLVVAPRNIERIADLKELLVERNFTFQIRSSININKEAQILLLDTFGELTKFYKLAYLAFIGGSFVPVGGHNLLEPAAQGCPVFYGPYIKNFREIADLLSENGVGFEVKDSRELADGCLNLFNNPEQRYMLGEKARSLVQANKGATDKMAALFLNLLNEKAVKNNEILA
jgi:3-deoxy-D-manno-octulosonic-acid transferase